MFVLVGSHCVSCELYTAKSLQKWAGLHINITNKSIIYLYKSPACQKNVKIFKSRYSCVTHTEWFKLTEKGWINQQSFNFLTNKKKLISQKTTRNNQIHYSWISYIKKHKFFLMKKILCVYFERGQIKKRNTLC